MFTRIWKLIKGKIIDVEPEITINSYTTKYKKLSLSLKEFQIIYESAIDEHTFHGIHHPNGEVHFVLKYDDSWWSGKFSIKKLNIIQEKYIEIYKVNIKKCLHCNSIIWELEDDSKK